MYSSGEANGPSQHIGIAHHRNEAVWAAARTINQAFNALIIIESVYAQRIFYVFKRGVAQGPRTNTNADPEGDNEEVIDRQKGNTWNFTGQDALPRPEAIADGKQAMRPRPFIWTGNQLSGMNAVAYSISCHDSPFEFNNKMDHQKTILNYRFGTHVAPYNKQEGTPLAYVRTQWAETLAPQNRYVDGKPSTTEEEKNRRQWDSYADGATGTAIAEYLGTGSAAIVYGTYYPYRPGYASERYSADKVNNTTPDHIKRSAGVDCTGFIQRSASYDGKAYLLPSVQGYTWTSGSNYNSGREYIQVTDYVARGTTVPAKVWKITDKKEGILDPVTKKPKYANLSWVIPGDIIYYGEAYEDYHVMMVAAVERSATGDVRPEDVKIIEATYGNYGEEFGYQCSVIKKTSLNYYITKNWVIGRLRERNEKD